MAQLGKRNLSLALADIDWVAIESVRHQVKVTADRLLISFGRRYAGDQTIRGVRVRIGRDIIESLGWKEKDKIGLCHHPDDAFNWRLMKRPEGEVGFSLIKETTGHYFTVNFSWPDNLPPLHKVAATLCDFEIYNNAYLIIDAHAAINNKSLKSFINVAR